MALVWRLCKAKWAHVAFSGAGAADNPGRWNSPGRRMVYCAESRALAALEIMAHTAKKAHLSKASFGAFGVEVPDDLVYRPQRLPPEWSVVPAPIASKRFGDRFLDAGNFPVMRVPSSVVRGEYCYLINPLHPRFPELRRAPAEPFAFDLRVVQGHPKVA